MPYTPKYYPEGTQFNSWTILSEGRVGDGPRIRRVAFCRCECGREKHVLVSELVKNRSTNCGCKRQIARRRGMTSKELETERTLRHKYGIDLKTREKLALAQNNKCAICKQEKPLCVDHCHNTQKIRGLLCDTCNRGIGFLKDNVEILQNAIDYLMLAR